SPAGSIARSSYLGSDGNDEAHAVRIDQTGVYVGGLELSTTFPGTSTVRTIADKSYAAFVTQLATDGSHVVKTQLLDGKQVDQVRHIAITRAGADPIVNVIGLTSSLDFPTTPDAMQKARQLDNS